jgi:hypothetical protein
MKRVTHYTEAEARDFFERLATYSAEYLRIALPNVHRHWPTDNCYDKWRLGHPIGHTIHYTAGVSYAGTVRHFVFGNRASTNWVIAKALDRRFDQLRKDLDLHKDLRAEISQVVPPTCPAWHAGWANRILASTEIRNAGILRPHPKRRGEPGQRSMSRKAFFAYPDHDVDDLNFYWWASGWTQPFEGEVLKVNGSWWESFSRGSIATSIIVCRYLNSLYPDRLDPVYMTAHHMLNPRKNDVVLPIDLDKYREAILFSNAHVDDLDWLAAYDDFEDGFEDLDDPWMLRELDEMQADRAEDEMIDGEFAVNEPIRDRISSTVDSLDEGAEALRRLGFYVEDERSIRESARIYQRGRKIEVDGIVGPATLSALDRDLSQWRIR